MSKTNKKATAALFELVEESNYTAADLEKIKSLLSEGADPNFREKEYPNETVLYRVISSWNDQDRLAIVKMLLEHGVDFNKTSDIFYPIDNAVIENDIVLVRFMLENGANQGLDYALKSAIERDNSDLATLLLSHTNPNLFEPYTQSYLTFCCEAYRVRDRNTQYETLPGIAMAQLLINHGADPNGIDHDSSSLLEAIRHDFYELVDLLLKNGAVVKPEMGAFTRANTVEMFQFLVEKGIIKDLNETALPRNETPIIYHTIQSNFEIVKFLIQNGADLYKKDKNGKTAFHHALWSENAAFIDYLLGHYDVRKCHEISPVFEGVDDKKTIKKLKAILDKTV